MFIIELNIRLSGLELSTATGEFEIIGIIKNNKGNILNKSFLVFNKQPIPIPKKLAITTKFEKKLRIIISEPNILIKDSSKNSIKKPIKKI